MKEIIIGQRTDGYDAPYLFPLAPYKRGNNLRDYVEARLVELAEAKQLHVTEVMNQPGGLSDVAGMIILGQAVDEDHIMRGAPIPPQLQGYLVRIRALHGDTVKWKLGKKTIGRKTQGTTRTGSAGVDGMERYPSVIERKGDYWLDTEETDTELPLASAWLCLRQAGKWCRPCKRTTAREAAWRYEEVFSPSTVDDDGPTHGLTEDLPRGRGRPRSAPVPA